jgi:cytochrome c oxidase assembly protein subunit 15
VTTVLISLGSYVRTTGAGLSCPDWPLCFGELVPDFSILGVPQEMIHRYIAKFVGVCCILLLAITYKKRNEFPKTFAFAGGMLVLVIIQGGFGALTVTMKLNPFIVATHLALGTIFWQLSTLALLERPVASKTASPELSKLTLGTVLLTFTQIVLGGYVAASGGSLACMDFPLCNGALIPENAVTPQLVQIAHRVLFVVLLGSIVFLIVRAKREGLKRGHLFGVASLVFLQMILGVHLIMQSI